MFFSLLLSFIVSLSFHTESTETWTLDRSNSSIRFEVDHLMISTVPGGFNDFDVQIHPQQDGTFDQSTLEANIKAGSIDTGNSQRDGHLQSPMFFDATTHPDIRLDNATMTFSDETNYQIIGDLTIKGHTKTITLDGTFGGYAKMWGRERAGFSAKGTINRFDFGINYSDKLDTGGWVVGEEIIFYVNLEFVK